MKYPQYKGMVYRTCNIHVSSFCLLELPLNTQMRMTRCLPTTSSHRRLGQKWEGKLQSVCNGDVANVQNPVK